MTVKIHVLGSAAGGGFPQWNCNCLQCSSVRAGRPGFAPRTQSSIAVSADGQGFALINASPDVRSQILGNPVLQPKRALRDSAIAGIVLIDAQIDHVTGLLLLRESTRPLHLYCTDRVHQDLTCHFPIIPMLDHYCGVIWHEIFADGRNFRVDGVDGVEFSAVALQSKAPPYSPHRREPRRGDNLGLLIGEPGTNHRAFYAPGLGHADLRVTSAMAHSQVLLVDGTCWTDDELVRCGVGTQSAMEMGHLAQSGPGGMMELLGQFPDKRRILIHVNNTNPILDEGGAERSELSRMGIDVACDGQIIEV
jgi:pyrroloquinoline quinone biosynthesis protein B